MSDQTSEKFYLTLQHKKYFYTLRKTGPNTTFVECEGAHIAQDFLNEDIPELLRDLPALIVAEKKYKKQQSHVIRFRVSAEDKKKIQKKALEKGYPSVSVFLREWVLRDR